MIRTTHSSSDSRLTPMAYLVANERAALIDAMDSGELTPIVDPKQGTIVGLVTHEHIDRMTDDNSEHVEKVLEELESLSYELGTLATIVKEVMVEKVPADFDYRILSCIDDAVDILNRARDNAEAI